MLVRNGSKSRALFAAAGLVALVSPFSASGVNLLLNPGFEAPAPDTSENTNATGWNFVGTAKRANFFNHTVGGNYSIWARTWEILGGGVTQDVANISGSATYNFSSQIYFESGFTSITDPVAATLKLSWFDASNNPVGSPNTLNITPGASPLTGAWTPYNLSVVSPATAAKVQVFVGWTDGGPGTGAQSAFFDDVVLDGPGIPPTGSNWAINGGGDWNIGGAWSNGNVPNGIGAEATLGNIITAAHTVYTDVPVTLGTINFDNSNMYVVAGAGSLTMQVATGVSVVNVVSGSHKINLPLYFASNTNISTPAGTTLTLADPVTIKVNKVVTRIGTGALQIQAPLTIEGGGTLVVGAAPMSVFGAPTMGTNAKINVGTQTLTVDYRGAGSPASTIESQLTTGYRFGLWNGAGIMSNSGGGVKGVGWIDDSASQSIKVKLTYYGDANVSGNVDSTDFNALIAGYGKTSGAIWSQGDFNYDDKVNTIDFNYLAGNFGATPIPASPGLGSVVPEPVSGVLALAGLAVLRRRR